jgi:hypothetical protein
MRKLDDKTFWNFFFYFFSEGKDDEGIIWVMQFPGKQEIV